MRTKLFAIALVLAVTLSITGTAFAGNDTPADSQGYFGVAPVWDPFEFDPAYTILGSVWDFEFWLCDPTSPAGTCVTVPNYPVNIWLYSPDTTGGWPLDMAQTAGTWFLPIGSSPFRRQSWPSYQGTNEFGYYYSEFMLPRDEAWYPCSFPCKWKCNFIDPVTGTYYDHSPYTLIYVYREPVGAIWDLLYPLYWPYADPLADTVHPLEAYATEGLLESFILDPGRADLLDWEFEVQGYFWSTRDLEVEWPLDYPALCPWQ